MINEIYVFGKAIIKPSEIKEIGNMLLKNVYVISDSSTNGDMMKHIFPNVPVKIFEDMNTVIFGNAQFDLDWWNAPYVNSEVNDGK